MKKAFTLLFILSSAQLVAQEQSWPLKVGLYAPFAIHPGIKIGTDLGVKSWQTEDGSEIRSESLYASPEFSVFRRFGIHTNYLINADVGYQRKSNQRKLYASTALGLGFLMRDQIVGTTIDLSSGNTLAKEKEWRRYFLPTLNFEFGKNTARKMGWYSKVSYGRLISSEREDSGFFALEFGMRWVWRNTTNEN